MSANSVAMPSAFQRLKSVLPQGHTLPEAEWRRRHHAMVTLLFAEAIGLGIFAAAEGYSPLHSIAHSAPLIPIGIMALLIERRQRLAAVLVSVGLITSCALLVHIWHGAIEGHFLFFVTIVILALYEDWVPFLVAAAYVVVHHGLMGALDPNGVYNHGDAVAHPWKWAMIHGGFVVAAGVACVAAWRLNEEVRAESREATRRAEEAASELAYAALHDSLTGLPNRRALFGDLDQHLPATNGDRRILLTLFDLNGFKDYNDTFGHPAGDSLLSRMGHRLQTELGDDATAYRMGGDEFCILAVLDGEDHESISARTGEALQEHGEGFDVTASYGSVVIPEEATTVEDALKTADERMYLRKSVASRASAGRQSADVLLKILSERSPSLGVHLDRVTALCETVASRLGMSDEDVAPMLQAASLHDTGKAAIPDEILHKPGVLDEDEWEFIRRHTVIGERILAAAPALKRAATLVRSSHERWDGDGYPDGLREEETPLASRIIFACDSYDAMTSDRPYARRRKSGEALEEIRANAGTQFDPQVAEALCEAVEAGAPGKATGQDAERVS